MTISELYGPAMEITDQAEADNKLAALITYCMKQNPGMSHKKAEEIQRSNLGYYAGYYDHETRARVERLFRCVHPIFGSIADNGAPTPEQAFQAGVEAGKKLRKRKAVK